LGQHVGAATGSQSRELDTEGLFVAAVAIHVDFRLEGEFCQRTFVGFDIINGVVGGLGSPRNKRRVGLNLSVIAIVPLPPS
jgi:hypothetical protein